MTRPPRWPVELTRATGRLIRTHRDRLGLSAQQLADRMAEEIGASYTRTQVTNLESGRREAITIGEVLAFARILGVAPLLLVVPLGADEDVELLPGVREDPWTVYRLFTGTLPWGAVVDNDERSRDDRATEYLEGNSVVDTYRDHDDALWNYLAFRSQADREKDENLVSAASAHLNRLVRVRADMRRNGWAYPDLPTVAIAAVEVAEAAARRDPYFGWTQADGASE